MERYQAFEDAYAALAHGGSAYGQQVQALDARMRPALQTLLRQLAGLPPGAGCAACHPLEPRPTLSA